MFAGHFGLAAAVKATEKNTPMWALMLGTQLLDVIFVPLFVSGKETIVSVHGEGYGSAIIHADYTHSLLGAIIISLLAMLAARRLWGTRSGGAMGLIVFSHWLLDLLVHQPDLPLLPGNAGALPLLGFGLWQHPSVSILLESILIAGGFLLYFRSALRRSRTVGTGLAANRTWAFKQTCISAAVMGLLLLGSLLSDVLLGG
ncbi:metal-dependent hydrolase [Paenibacillus sp. R14(2021)]|uniref:metal-dependent hydrolase n=1 Tax=Paenibacillus sp. R14(2021) TaxID=2859228 RepID=UPI001C61480E|nr:metal-dependent hydrolase [Paenibacillus sp. R14(2021)]